MPAFAAMVFRGVSNALALLMAGAGHGALVASIAMSTQIVQVRLPLLIAAGQIGVTISLVVFGASESLYAGIAGIALSGLSTTTVSVRSQSMVQINTICAVG